MQASHKFSTLQFNLVGDFSLSVQVDKSKDLLMSWSDGAKIRNQVPLDPAEFMVGGVCLKRTRFKH